MHGQIDIELTLDQAGIMMLGNASIAAAAGTLDTTLSSTIRIFRRLWRYSNINGAVLASGAAQCVLLNISFHIVRMDRP
jgi:hypothetical protein